MKKIYFIELRKNEENGSINHKTIFYHKPIFMSLRKMIEDIFKTNDEWQISKMYRIY